MRILVTFCLVASFYFTFGQNTDLSQSYALHSYSEVPINWKMDGKLQVFLNEGINFLIEGNPEAALSNLEEFVEKDSSFWIAYYYKGICNRTLGRYTKAEKDLLRANSLNRASYEVNLELAKVYQLKRDSKNAEKYYNKSIEINPRDPVVYLLKGDLELNQNNFEGAVDYYKTALKKDSLFSEARIKIGIIEIFKTKNNRAGLPFLNDVLEKDSLNLTALTIRGLINSKLNPKQSLLDFNVILKRRPENLNIRFLRGLLLTELNDYENSFTDLRRVIQSIDENENNFIGQQTNLDKRIDILNAGQYLLRIVYGIDEVESRKIKKGFCLLLIGKQQDCINSLNEVKESEKSALCVFLKAVAYEHMGMHEMALKFYNAAISIDNEITDAHKKRGIYLMELQKWNSAEKDFSDALKINPHLYIMYKLRGVTKYHQKNFKEADQDFTRYLRSDSSNSEVFSYRGMTRIRQGKFLDSVKDFLVSSNSIAINKLELTDSIHRLLVRRDTLKALSYLNSYLRIRSRFTDARILKIEILVGQKKWGDVEKEVNDEFSDARRLSNSKEADSYLRMVSGLVLLSKNQEESALERFNWAIGLNEKNGRAFLERGKILLRRQQPKLALKDIKTASKLGLKEAKGLIREIKISN